MNNEIIIRAFYSVSYKFLYYASQKGNEAALALAEHVWSTGHASGEPVQGRGHGQPPHCNNKVPPRELAHSAPPQHPELGEETLPREYTALLD